ncbi:MAG: RluA family pseudouridine synthase [Eubacteriales bacterium]|jgi:23S rRNA pseudouridine955/2504/2580 synthase
MKEIRITAEEASQRLDKFLKRYLPEAGGGFLYKQLRKKNITLNGGKASGKEMLQVGDTVRIWFSDETLRKFAGQEPAVSAAPLSDRKNLSPAEKSAEAGKVSAIPDPVIIYEDDAMLIADKPAGVLSQPDSSGEPSMVEIIRNYLLKTGQMTEEDFRLYRPGVVNRLDRNTSGLIVAAKTLHASQKLSEMIRTRAVDKYYLTLVGGVFPEKKHLKAYLRKNPGTRKVEVMPGPAEGAAEIETECEPVRILRFGEMRCTLLSVKLLTGRTHQIRSHLSYIGHPVAGDVKYGSVRLNRIFRERYGLDHQFLHAARMIFPEGPDVTAPLPRKLENILNRGVVDEYTGKPGKH